MRTTGRSSTQQPSAMPVSKYRPASETNPLSLPDRTWPAKTITKAPRWLSTDLRDGNQALIEPMSPEQKRKMFSLLVNMGFKEIEIGFPAASQTDFDFVRSLVKDSAVPEAVTVSVLTQSRADLIDRTFDAIDGLPRATVHLYNAISPLFREVVFKNSKQATVDLAVTGAQQIIATAEKRLSEETIFGFEYSPEIFVDAEIDFALEICNAVTGVWHPDADRELIINLPATVERTSPNVFADRVEYMSRNLAHREHIALSVHTHNDRGSAVAAAELAIMAGADRVEGCLAGQGERTGNVDLVTLAMNLFSSGVDPMLDLSNIDEVRRTVEHCTGMRVPDRAPYMGDLVYTSFSGSHQDAIKKGFAARKDQLAKAGSEEDVPWQIPYLPIDPHDVGRSYEAVVRVNSQSGKGGVAYVMASKFNIDMPRRLQIEFSRIIQRHTDTYGGEIDPDAMWNIFVDEYLPYGAAKDESVRPWGRFALRAASSITFTDGNDEVVEVTCDYTDEGIPCSITSRGNGPIDAFCRGFGEEGIAVHVLDYFEHAMSSGHDAVAAAFVEADVDGQVLWGVGIDPSITRASYKAIISAVNRSLR